ncbi:cell division protein FtsQ/DivIB [Martelella soudanensis]|uniref:cell division protein FtsQ/DivIB n=1 Tax=unclassified Martelella TaxID=2629616 RepID=UPI0015DF84C1|nr:MULTISPECIES: cell division protein FtsQ/DivIB [unclassified Martelella]
MFALKTGKDDIGESDRMAAGSRAGVLPRPFRRLVRATTGIFTGRTSAPKHVGSAVALVFFAVVGANGIVVAGKGDLVRRAAFQLSGFAVEDIQISGNSETSEIVVLQNLGLEGAYSLQGVDIQAARGQLLNLPWVADADIRKVYPSTLKITLKERHPYALWQQEDGRLLMIERDGNIIGPLSAPKFRRLPLVLGQGGNVAAEDVEELLQEWPELGERVRAFKRIDERRWDLYLDNGMIIKLPAQDSDAAIVRLRALENDRSILEREIAAVDLRLDDRVAIQLTPTAMERRDAALEALQKTFKNKGRRL